MNRLYHFQGTKNTGNSVLITFKHEVNHSNVLVLFVLLLSEIPLEGFTYVRVEQLQTDSTTEFRLRKECSISNASQSPKFTEVERTRDSNKFDVFGRFYFFLSNFFLFSYFFSSSQTRRQTNR